MQMIFFLRVLIFILVIGFADAQTRLNTQRKSYGTVAEPQLCLVYHPDTAQIHGFALAANYVLAGSKNSFSTNMFTGSLGYTYYFSRRIYAGLNYNWRNLPTSGSQSMSLQSSQVRLSLGHDGNIRKLDFIKNLSFEKCYMQGVSLGWFFKLATTVHYRFGAKWGSALSMEAGIFRPTDPSLQNQEGRRTFSLTRFKADAYYQIHKNIRLGAYWQRHTAYFNVLALSTNPNIPAQNAFYPTNFVFSHIGLYGLIQIPNIKKSRNTQQMRQQYRYLYAQPEFLFF